MHPSKKSKKEYSVSILLAARNEAGNIEKTVLQTPDMGLFTELIFIEGGSDDNTLLEIRRVIKQYRGKKRIRLIEQKGANGKAQALRMGTNEAKGNIIIIHDVDLTVSPKVMSKFYEALKTRKGDYVQGTRFIYPMAKNAMPFMNKIGNIFFSLLISLLIRKRITDAFCGTKAIFRKEYEKIVFDKNFGKHDRFGDFDLIVGARLRNLKFFEIPVIYYPRIYGKTKLQRLSDGWTYLKMIARAAWKMK